MRQHKYEYDAFISHAVEDKIPIANELCAKLERAGLKIWYSGKELGIGDSIEKTIEKGLNRSRYGIVIFSPTYLAKNWTIREFYTLLAKEIEEQKVILPVLYNITLDELKNKDLLMADRFAVNADLGTDFVVERLVREIRKPKLEKQPVAWFSRIWLVLILSLLANVGLLVKDAFQTGPPNVLSVHGAGDPVRSQIANATLLDEMQGLVKQFGTCSCTHAPDVRQETLPAQRLVTNRPADLQLVPNSEPDVNTPRNTGSHRKAGSKMTMAVVFQIETAGAEEHAPGTEVDEMLQTIGSPEDETEVPFLMVSNREDYSRARRECSRPAQTGE